jgi:hypothetical protein
VSTGGAKMIPAAASAAAENAASPAYPLGATSSRAATTSADQLSSRPKPGINTVRANRVGGIPSSRSACQANTGMKMTDGITVPQITPTVPHAYVRPMLSGSAIAAVAKMIRA